MLGADPNRLLPAVLKGGPRSPHVVTDVYTVLSEKGYKVSLVSVDRESVQLVVDGVDIMIRAGAYQDNTPGELWFFVGRVNTSGFVRVNVAQVLKDAPYLFKDSDGNTHFLNLDSWMDIWPKAPSSWEDFSRDVLKMSSEIVETRDFVYLDELAFVQAIEFILKTV